MFLVQYNHSWTITTGEGLHRNRKCSLMFERKFHRCIHPGVQFSIHVWYVDFRDHRTCRTVNAPGGASYLSGENCAQSRHRDLYSLTIMDQRPLLLSNREPHTPKVILRKYYQRLGLRDSSDADF